MKYAITVITSETGGDHREALYQETLDAIDTEHCDVETVCVTQDGVWKRNDKTVNPEQALLWADYVWIAGFGPGVEDGVLQRILDEHRVPYNGSDAMMSRICARKSATKDLLEHKQIKTPVWERYELSGDIVESLAGEIFTAIPQPCVVKSDTWQEGAGVHLCQTKAQIRDALVDLATYTGSVVAEEYIKGVSVTVGVIRDMRDQVLYVLPPVEIALGEQELFATDMVSQSDDYLRCPPHLDVATNTTIAELGKTIHQELELGDYSRIDMVVHPSRGIFVLDINTIPGYAKGSAMRYAMEEVGISLDELVDVCIKRKLS